MAEQAPMVDQPWPAEVSVESGVNSVTYTLPVRQWPGQWSGWILLACGMGMVAVGIGIPTLTISQPINGSDLVALTVGLTIALGGLLLCFWGQSTLFGYCQIILREGELLVVSRASGLRLTKRHSTSTLSRLIVRHGWDGETETGAHAQMLYPNAFMMIAEHHDGTRRKLITWYPMEYLQPIAQDIARHLSLTEPVEVLNLERETEDSDEAGEVPQPPESAIKMQPTDDGLSIMVPPMKLLRSSDGRSVTSVLGGGLLGAAAGLFAMLLVPLMGGGFGMWWIWVIVSIPAVAGGLYVAAGVLGQRDTYIDIVGDTMLITTRGWRNIRQLAYERDQVKTIKQGDSLVEINDKTLPQLHIELYDGDTVRMFTGRSEQELQWLAGVLRKTLGVGLEARHRGSHRD
jgi:hypothetical protein